MQKINILTCAMLLLFSVSTSAQIGKNFPKEIKALIEAGAPELMQNETKAENGYNMYRTALKLDGFEISYIVSNVIGNVLSAKYLQKGNDDTMDKIYERFNEIPYLVFDSKYRQGLIKKDEENLVRKILLKSRDTGKNVLIATLDKAGAIHFLFKP